MTMAPPAPINAATDAARPDAAQLAAADYPIRLQDAEPATTTAPGAARDIPAATTPAAGSDPSSRRAP